MPVPRLNNMQTGGGSGTYPDNQTVRFDFARPAFTMNVTNAAIYYQLQAKGPSDREGTWETAEHFLLPSLNNFDSPSGEGFPDGYLFTGVRVRSAVTGVPAGVTVA